MPGLLLACLLACLLLSPGRSSHTSAQWRRVCDGSRRMDKARTCPYHDVIVWRAVAVLRTATLVLLCDFTCVAASQVSKAVAFAVPECGRDTHTRSRHSMENLSPILSEICSTEVRSTAHLPQCATGLAPMRLNAGIRRYCSLVRPVLVSENDSRWLDNFGLSLLTAASRTPPRPSRVRTPKKPASWRANLRRLCCPRVRR